LADKDKELEEFRQESKEYEAELEAELARYESDRTKQQELLVENEQLWVLL
jgi:hypothetical protein